MTTGHFIKRCKHGFVVAQCRCPRRDKRVIYVSCSNRCAAQPPPEHVIVAKSPPTKETDEYEWPLTGERLKMWGADDVAST